MAYNKSSAIDAAIKKALTKDVKRIFEEANPMLTALSDSSIEMVHTYDPAKMTHTYTWWPTIVCPMTVSTTTGIGSYYIPDPPEEERLPEGHVRITCKEERNDL